MSMIMAGTVSAIVTAVSSGMGDGYLQRWLSSYTLAWPIAFVVLLLLRPHVTRLSERLTGAGHSSNTTAPGASRWSQDSDGHDQNRDV
ncbi:hypothetical protein CHH28_09640 [Bacterioplanes sanyensis]|uniref:DUF2798 domain-containing protein n=1 Tax=Bacterioplanes sanyensis TaxID=1249553 RepID=A0A222FR56_9GAMM|nr:hypothetical protein CHH28_09640 [Bacterioplanes sanyensis]